MLPASLGPVSVQPRHRRRVPFHPSHQKIDAAVDTLSPLVVDFLHEMNEHAQRGHHGAADRPGIDPGGRRILSPQPEQTSHLRAEFGIDLGSNGHGFLEDLVLLLRSPLGWQSRHVPRAAWQVIASNG